MRLKEGIIDCQCDEFSKETTASHYFSTVISNYSIILAHGKLFFLSKLDLKDAKIFLMGGISFSLSASGT